MQNNTPHEERARELLQGVRAAYENWLSEHRVTDYPAAESLFRLPVPDVMRWLATIARNLRLHGIHPGMQHLLRDAIRELETLGFKPAPED